MIIIKLSKKLLLFNFIIINILTFEVLYSNIFIYTNSKTAPVTFLILSFITLLFLIIYPNIYHKLYNIINNHIFIKIMFLIYLIILISYSFGFTTFVFKHWFYHKTPYILILLSILFSTLIVSKNSSFILYNGFISGIIVIAFNLLPIFNSIPRNFNFIKELNFTFDYNYIFLIFTLLDSIIILFYSSKLEEKQNKKSIITSFIFISIFTFIMILENYLFVVPDVLINTVNPSFLKYQIYFINYLIDNIDVILIINIIYFCFTKLAIYLNLFRNLLNHKNSKTINILINIVIFLSSLLFYLLIFNDSMILNKLSLPLTIILLLVLCCSIFYRKEINNEIL